MAVMRQSCCEGGSVVEGELGLTFGQFELLLEGINFCPIGEYVFFLGWEVRLFGHYCNKQKLDSLTSLDIH